MLTDFTPTGGGGGFDPPPLQKKRSIERQCNKKMFPSQKPSSYDLKLVSDRKLTVNRETW